MKTKRIIAAALAVCMALTVVSCGNSESGSAKVKDPDNITEEDFEKAAEKLDSMSEEDLEKALEGVDGGEETTSSAEKKEGYEPCQEILDADFTSGLIQIGNDVFKCGGYLTVSDLVNQYGDRYDFDVDLNKALTEGDGEFEFTNKENKTLVLLAGYAKKGDTIGEAVVYDVRGKSKADTFYPKGIKGYNESEPSKTARVELNETNQYVQLLNSNCGTNSAINYDDLYGDENRPKDRSEFWLIPSLEQYSTYNDKNNILYCFYRDIINQTPSFYATLMSLNDSNLFGFKPYVSCVIKEDGGHFAFDYAQYKISESNIIPEKPKLIMLLV